jgi:hypothetical protein
MNTEKFHQIYNEYRNGCNGFYRHPLVRNFVYSDGVRDLAETGCWWLIDKVATEIPDQFKLNPRCPNSVINVAVGAGIAKIWAEFIDDEPVWVQPPIHTDMPDGLWQFYIADEGGEFRCILLSEY